jgi:hypothetical protein
MAGNAPWQDMNEITSCDYHLLDNPIVCTSNIGPKSTHFWMESEYPVRVFTCLKTVINMTYLAKGVHDILALFCESWIKGSVMHGVVDGVLVK